MMVGKVLIRMETEIVVPLPGITPEMVADKFTESAQQEISAEVAKGMAAIAEEKGARIISVSASASIVEV